MLPSGLLKDLEESHYIDPSVYDRLAAELSRMDPEKDYLQAALLQRGMSLSTRVTGSSNIRNVQEFAFLLENEIGRNWSCWSNAEIDQKLTKASLFLAEHARQHLPRDCCEGEKKKCFRCNAKGRKECRHYVRLEAQDRPDVAEFEDPTMETDQLPVPKTLNLTIGFDRKTEELQRHRQKIQELQAEERELTRRMNDRSRRRYLALGAYAEVAALKLYLQLRKSTLASFEEEGTWVDAPFFVVPEEAALELKKSLSSVQLTRRDLRAAYDHLCLVRLDPSTCHSYESKILLHCRLQEQAETARGIPAEEQISCQRMVLDLKDVAEMMDSEDSSTRVVLTTFAFNRWLDVQDLKSSQLEWTRPEKEQQVECCILPLYERGLFGIRVAGAKLYGSDICRLLAAYLVHRLQSGAARTNSRAVHAIARGVPEVITNPR